MSIGLPDDVFRGLTILDLTRLLPGPFCTMLFAELGARVIKVEAPEGGDYARWYAPIVEGRDGGYGAFFESVNRGKESIAVDVRNAEGREVLRKLIQRADVLIESFRPGVLDRLGFPNEELRKLNVGLIVCRITGYGQDGPFRDRAGHDLNYMARSGALSLAGPRDAPPAIPSVQVADLAGGALYAAFAISAAIYRRSRVFQGVELDIAMTEGVLSLLRPFVTQSLAVGSPPARGDDMLTGGLPCYGVYETRDGRYMALAALEPRFWSNFCLAAGCPELLDGGLLTGAAGAAVAEQLRELFRSRTRDEWATLLADHDACCEPVLELDEVVADAHMRARNAIRGQEGRSVISTPGLYRNGKDPSVAPLLGEHTRAIAREVGLDPSRIDALIERGVLGVHAR